MTLQFACYYCDHVSETATEAASHVGASHLNNEIAAYLRSDKAREVTLEALREVDDELETHPEYAREVLAALAAHAERSHFTLREGPEAARDAEAERGWQGVFAALDQRLLVRVSPDSGDMDDDKLLEYASIHARTELALFHRDHVRRVCELAGEQCGDNLPLFVSVHAGVMDPLVAKARARREKDDR